MASLGTESKEKAVWFVNSFPSDSIGGAETAVRGYTQAIQNLGYQVIWHHPSSAVVRNNQKGETPTDVKVRCLDSIPARGFRRFPSPRSVVRFAENVRRENPHRIIFNCYNDFYLPLLFALKVMGRDEDVVYVFHGDPRPPTKLEKARGDVGLTRLAKDKLLPLKHLFTKLTLENSRVKVVAVSSSTAEGIMALGYAKSVQICYPPGQPDLNCIPFVRETDSSTTQAVTVSRVSPEKGMEWLGKIAQACHEQSMPVDFSLVGPCINEKYLTQVTKYFGGQVNLRGPKRGNDLCQTYLDADIVIMLSPKEGFGLVTVEALQHMRPVIAKNISAQREIFASFNGDKPGFLVNSDDDKLATQQAVEALREFSQNTSLRRRLSISAQGARKLFNQVDLSNQFANVALS